ncbi:LuxR C-terminal-related transcriptional regulator [Nocardioides sp.]|uniref:helix-turn-helix transcriptional regulator n=1 Tax=Nocardioides sp. TaxID=35761 RepID=UPI0035685F79
MNLERLLTRGYVEADFTERLSRLAQGEGSALLLEADAGLGKTVQFTRLLELADQAGVRTASATAQPLVAQRDYAGVVAALGPLIDQDPELATGLPELDMLFGAAHHPASPATRRARESTAATVARLHDSLATVVSRACTAGPVILAFDDVHLADGPTLDFLHAVLSDVGSHPLLLLLTARPEDSADPTGLLTVRRALERRTFARRTSIEPMNHEEVAALCTLWLGPCTPGLVDQLATASGGVPFVLAEQVRDLERRGLVDRTGTQADAISVNAVRRRSARGLVEDRLASVPPEARAACALLGLVGEGSGRRWWAAKLNREAVPVLLDHGLLIGSSDRPTLRHPLVGEVALAGLSDLARHRLVTDLLSLAPDDETKALLLLHGGRRAAFSGDTEILCQSASASMARGSPAQASKLLAAALERCTEVKQRARVHQMLGQAWAARGEHGLAANHFRRTLDLATDQEVELRANAALGLTDAQFRAGSREGLDFSGLEATLERQGKIELLAEVNYHALVDAGRRGDPVAAAAAHHTLRRAGRSPRSALFRDVVAEMSVENSRTPFVVLHRAGRLEALLERCHDEPALAERCVHALSDDADVRGSVPGLDRAIERERRLPGVHGWRARLHYVERCLAVGHLDAALEASARLTAAGPAFPLALAARIQRARGDVAAAETAFTDAVRSAQPGEQNLMLVMVLALGIDPMPTHAEALLDRPSDQLNQIALPTLVHLATAEALVLLDRPELDDLLDSWQILGPDGVPTHLMAHARLISARGLEAGARAKGYAEAAGLFADLGRTMDAAIWRAEAVAADPATTHLSDKQIVRSGRLLAKAGAELRVETLTAALEHRDPALVRRIYHQDPQGLTAREREVANLAASGHSVREIASALFVAMPTVTGHLDRVLTKLGLTSVSALSGALSN